jgi:hypothetical protein
VAIAASKDHVVILTDDGRLLRLRGAPTEVDTGGIAVGDFAVAPAGDIYFTDLARRSLYHLPPPAP